MKIKLFYVAVSLLAFILGCFASILFLPKPITSEAASAILHIQIKSSQVQAEKLDVYDIDRDFFNDWSAEGVEVLETGKGFEIEEIQSRNGDTMLALVYENGKSFLRSTRVSITKSKEPAGVLDGVDISVKGHKRPRFLLRNPGYLRPGKVETVFSSFASFDDETGDYGFETAMIGKNTPKVLHLGDSTYTFEVEKGLNKLNDKIFVLTLSDGDTKQVITAMEFYPGVETEDYVEGVTNNLIWAGDLDQDGKLDFYMEPFSEKGGLAAWLFLSSRAEEGKLVKMVGGFWTMGC